MDFSKMSLEEFSTRLKGRPPSELQKFAKGEGVKLPLGLKGSALIQAFYAAVQAKDASPSSADEVASSLGTDEDGEPQFSGPKFMIVCMSGRASYWRCKRQWTHSWSTHYVSEFTEKEMAVLRADPFLRIKDLPEG